MRKSPQEHQPHYEGGAETATNQYEVQKAKVTPKESTHLSNL